MFTRYKTDSRGRNIPVAKVYTHDEHPIRNSQIDKDALWVIRRIQANGEKAYIVGGAIRDLMLGRSPKDFDIATSASPKQIQRLFWNSRIIGRRFRIVHIFFNNKIIEVTTFRSDEENFGEGNNNIFGTMEQDSHRRDFSINSLYYNPQDGHLIDFNNSMADFEKKRIRSLIPLKYSFTEDPVRMVRALKYQATTGFSLTVGVRFAIWRDHRAISSVSTSRLTDEISKILSSGHSATIFSLLSSYRLLPLIAPCISQYMKYDRMPADLTQLDERIRDSRSQGVRDVSEAEMISYLARSVIVLENPDLPYEELRKEVYRQIKVLLSPLTPPNYEIEKAVEFILSSMGHRARRKQASRKKNPKGQKNPSQRKPKKKAGAAVEAPVSAKTSAEAHDM
ncbi:MAG: poly(A) polymerase [Bullifex sp.]